MAKITLVIQDYKDQVAVDAYFDNPADCTNPTNACQVAQAFLLLAGSTSAPKIHTGPVKVVPA